MEARALAAEEKLAEVMARVQRLELCAWRRSAPSPRGPGPSHRAARS